MMIAFDIEMKASLPNEPTPEWQIVTFNLKICRQRLCFKVYGQNKYE